MTYQCFYVLKIDTSLQKIIILQSCIGWEKSPVNFDFRSNIVHIFSFIYFPKANLFGTETNLDTVQITLLIAKLHISQVL